MIPRAWLVVAALWTFLLAQTGCGTGSNAAKRNRELLARHDFASPSPISQTAREDLAPMGVWKIQGRRNTVYIAGTSHLITPEQIPFPSAFYAAYNDSREVWVEATPDSISILSKARLLTKTLGWMKKNRAEFFAPRGKTIADYLQPQIVEKLKARGEKDYSNRKRSTPLFAAFMAQLEGFANQYENDGGVEDVFAARAKKDRKPLRTLDDASVDQLIVPVLDQILNDLRAEMTKSGPDALIEKTILTPPAKIQETAWRNGDLPALMAELQEEKEKAPALFEELGPKRNRKWLPKIERALQLDRNVFILVGCAHLPGNDGLLQLLGDAGFECEQLYGVDHLRR